MLRVDTLSVTVDQKTILHSVSLRIELGKVHVIMGPNGSGKSTLAHVLMGYPAYTITNGQIWFNGTDITHSMPDVRACAGIFLAVQNPYSIPGVRISSLLKEASRALRPSSFCLQQFLQEIQDYCTLLSIDRAVLERSINEGFSGGEKKKLEILQMLVCKPSLVILDEIDSGLDIDALALIGKAISYARQQNSALSILVITHYQRILQYLIPDMVHIMSRGHIIDSGDLALVHTIEQRGYHEYQ
ncbi:MAG TPA: Fe-S cluster assembly ATPase SufC [Candidatus Babeliales bacterium]|jgi:Fe-S cluster assembly ATP-binding protein|nr:Fe-S cluster assembly ATPase SufC [Candidatus Babeliales bacterium]